MVEHPRHEDVDRAKGLAILLVVFGHVAARESPPGTGWYEPLRIAVYLFHMPFFMYLSGYVSGLGSRPAPPWRRRAGRLLTPFAAFGAAVVCGKAAASGFVAVDHAPAAVPAGLRDLIWHTRDSAALSVWYLAVLFVFGVAAPPALAALGGRTGRLWAAALALYALPAPAYLYLDRICTYFVFYVAGAEAARHGEAWRDWIDRRRAPLLAAFAALLAAGALWAVPRFGFAGWPYKAWLLAAGMLSMPAVHALARALGSDALLRLGGLSLPIYLLNTIFIGAAKAALLTALPWDAASFPIFAAVLMGAGVLGPVGAAAALSRARHLRSGARDGPTAAATIRGTPP